MSIVPKAPSHLVQGLWIKSNFAGTVFVDALARKEDGKPQSSHRNNVARIMHKTATSSQTSFFLRQTCSFFFFNQFPIGPSLLLPKQLPPNAHPTTFLKGQTLKPKGRPLALPLSPAASILWLASCKRYQRPNGATQKNITTRRGQNSKHPFVSFNEKICWVWLSHHKICCLFANRISNFQMILFT